MSVSASYRHHTHLGPDAAGGGEKEAEGSKEKMDRGGGEGLIKKENEGVECQREAEPINVS